MSSSGGDVTKRRHLTVVGLLIFPLLSGFATVTGAALNGESKRLLESLLWSVAISTWMSFCLSLVISIFAPAPPFVSNVKRAYAETKNQPKLIPIWFQAPLQLTFLFMSAYLPEYIGLGIFYVVVTFCQIFCSLIFDMTGFFWTIKRPVYWQGWLGGFLVLLGGGLFQFREFSGKSMISGGPLILCLFLTVVGGVSSMIVPLLAIRVASYIGPYRGTAYAYGMGGLIMGTALLVTWTVPAPGAEPSDWWKFFGGLFGMTNLLLNVIFARKLGYAIHYSTLTGGSLLTSLVMDSLGFAGLEVVPICPSRVGGLLVVGCGVGFFAWNKLKAVDLEDTPAEESKESGSESDVAGSADGERFEEEKGRTELEV